MAHYDIQEDAWDTFQEINERLLGGCPQHTLETYRKELRRFASEAGWEDLLGLEDRALFSNRSQFLFGHICQIVRQRHRRPQLAQFQRGYFIYRASDHCCHHHCELDGACLPWDHPIWADYLPPNGWGCGCSIFATSFARQAIRRGFDPNGPLPTWLGKTDPKTTLPIGIEAGFAGNKVPSMWDALVAVSDGLAD